MKYSEIFYMKSCDETISHIKQLIKSKQLNEPDTVGETLLGTAVNYRRMDAVNFLIENGVDVNQKSGGLYPLEIASSTADINLIEVLIQNGAVIQEDNHSLAISIANGAGYAVVSYLLNLGANPDDIHDDCTALWWSADAMNASVMELLLKSGANPNMLDESGETCLNKAIYEAFVLGVKLLIKYGIDVNLTKKMPPLHAARIYAPSLVYLLLDNGADINIKDEDGRTLLFHERLYNNFPLCDYLLKSGANPAIKDNYGYTFFDLDDEVLREKLYDEFEDEEYF